MNDPNGPIFYEGEYHIFYQHNPFDNEWGHMSWGHAVSRDLVHWRNLPVAIPERNGIMIFSGSTVADLHNSSGFCKGVDHASCLVAIYTGHSTDLQTQNLAFSNDRGRSWTPYDGNPVIDLHLADFRDPKVFWYAPDHRWIMVAALPPQHKVRFFGSTDLKHWIALSDFGPAGAVGGVWECPDLFELPVEGQPGQTRWVLSVNLNPGGVAGGSGDQYFVGRFDGTNFQNQNPPETVLWADYGMDFYASTSFSNLTLRDGARVWIGWLDNWEYAGAAPTNPWRGALTIPRALKLRSVDHGLQLVQQPVDQLRTLRREHVAIADQGVDAANQSLQKHGAKGEALEIQAEIDPGDADEFGFRLRKGATEETLVGVDLAKSELFVDRSRSGDGGFSRRFAGRQTSPLELNQGQPVRLQIFVDRSSVEVFANAGETVISDLIFPSASSQRIEFYSRTGQPRIRTVDVWKLASAWTNSENRSH